MVEKKRGFSAVCSNLGFVLLWLGQLTSQLADRIFVYTLMLIVYQSTNSNLGVSLPLLAFGVPSLLVAPWAGILVDRLDRKGILVVTSVIRGALILLIVPLIAKSLLGIFLVSLLLYTAAQFFAPAETSSIPELVDKHNLIVANSLFMITWMASNVVGFGFGAPLVNIFGNDGTFIAAAVLYFISAGAVALVPLKPHEPRSPHRDNSFMKDMIFGVEFIRRNVIVRYSLFKLFVATSAIAIISLLAITYAKDVLNIGAKNFGYLIIVVGLGMLVGIWLLERLQFWLTKGVIVILSFIISGLTLIFLGGVNNVHLAFFLIFTLGIANIFITSSIQTILQSRIPRRIRGRVFGLQNMLINSAFVFPVILAGLLADLYSVQTTLVALGWVVAIIGVMGIFLPKFRSV
jgi:predicted MFS family arabinose efflux permease